MTSTPHPFQRAMPVLEVADMARSLAFYKVKLGFDAATWGEPASFAIVQRGAVSLALNVVAVPAVSRKTWAAYIYVRDADAVHAELSALGVSIPHPPETKPYNCREFLVDDPDGHMLAIANVLGGDILAPDCRIALAAIYDRNLSHRQYLPRRSHPRPMGQWERVRSLDWRLPVRRRAFQRRRPRPRVTLPLPDVPKSVRLDRRAPRHRERPHLDARRAEPLPEFEHGPPRFLRRLRHTADVRVWRRGRRRHRCLRPRRRNRARRADGTRRTLALCRCPVRHSRAARRSHLARQLGRHHRLLSAP